MLIAERFENYACRTPALPLWADCASRAFGAVREALLRIAGNGFRQFSKPVMNCTCFLEVRGGIMDYFGRFGAWGAIHEASLRIARKCCRLRLSQFRQFVKPLMNCTCFRSDKGLSRFRQFVKPLMNCTCFRSDKGLSRFRQFVKPLMNCTCFRSDRGLSRFRQFVKPLMNCTCFREVRGGIMDYFGRFGAWGAIHEASLRIARKCCRLRLSQFRQFVKPLMNCTCFQEVKL